nr:hypothetical protein BaRGS_010106 [Batillaria attramentaria]
MTVIAMIIIDKRKTDNSSSNYINIRTVNSSNNYINIKTTSNINLNNTNTNTFPPAIRIVHHRLHSTGLWLT